MKVDSLWKDFFYFTTQARSQVGVFTIAVIQVIKTTGTRCYQTLECCANDTFTGEKGKPSVICRRERESKKSVCN